MKQRSHIILGTGQLGLAIMDELVRDGVPVKLVNRSGKINEALPDCVLLETADLSDPTQVAAVCDGAEIVFFCLQPPYHKWPELFPMLAQSVVEGLTESGAKLVFGSNLYLYGDPDGALIHEALPHNAKTRKGKTRIKLAKIFLEAHESGDLPVVIGRASDFYGPRVTQSVAGDILFRNALEGKAVDMVGDIDLPHSFTYIRDFARSLITLSRYDEAFGQAWHVPNAETVTPQRFLDIVEKEIGQPVKTRVAGRLMLRLIGLFNPNVYEMIELLYEFEKPFVVDHSKYAARFPVQVTPFEEGIKQTVAWYRNRYSVGQLVSGTGDGF